MEWNNNSRKTSAERRAALYALVHLKTHSLVEKIWLLISPFSLLKRKSAAFINRFSGSIVTEVSASYPIGIKPYEGNNPTAISLRNLVLSQLKDDLADVIVHGSIADETVCPYSDFDCLIILKDELLQSSQRLSRTAFKLWQWQKLMLKTDLLQHHGWFVVFGSDFRCWDQSYLPAEVLSCSKSLLHQKEYELKIAVHPDQDYLSPFLKLCDELTGITGVNIRRMNSYEIKTLISRFFLMPALYYQARYKKGISKKDSFTSARSDFSTALWKPVTELSMLRTEWQQSFSWLTIQLIHTFFLWPSGYRKWVYPQPPEQIKQTVIQNWPAIQLLLQEMKKKVA
jgi:hypothetical protein